MASRYRKKPVVVEAKKFLGTWQSWDEINYWVTGSWLEEQTVVGNIDWSTYEIETLEGVMVASTGDYIIKGVQGEFYPCKPDIFDQTYEAVEDNFCELGIHSWTFGREACLSCGIKGEKK